jgi:Xaa-Pro aminopeptidase
MHNERRRRAGGLLGENRLDALLITNLHNIRYLTGFTGSNGQLLLLRDGTARLLTDPRYDTQSRQETSCRVEIVSGPLYKAAAKAIGKTRVRRVGFEAGNSSWANWKALDHAVPSRVDLRPSDGLVEGLRQIKDEAELELIRASCALNSRALEKALQHFRSGMTEMELAAEIDYTSRKEGATGPAFETIVAGSTHSALPHAQPRPKAIGKGALLIDMGAFRAGYASDMTRTVHVGAAGAKFRRAYKAVLEAQMAALHAVRDGATTKSVDRAARRALHGYDLDSYFTHSTGHGLGLEIHEKPRIARSDKTRLRAGMAVTIEPGVYIEGWGGIRIEDTVVVTARGFENLTPTPKELREL